MIMFKKNPEEHVCDRRDKVRSFWNGEGLGSEFWEASVVREYTRRHGVFPCYKDEAKCTHSLREE